MLGFTWLAQSNLNTMHIGKHATKYYVILVTYIDLCPFSECTSMVMFGPLDLSFIEWLNVSFP